MPIGSPRPNTGLTLGAAQAPARESSSPRRRIVLVDDNPQGRNALARLLQLSGFDVTSLGEGSSAMRLLEEQPPPDALLTDLTLPDVDGSVIIKRANQLTPRPLVVLITGWSAEDRPDAAGLDVDHLYLKPIDATKLVAMLRQAFSQPRAQGS